VDIQCLLIGTRQGYYKGGVFKMTHHLFFAEHSNGNFYIERRTMKVIVQTFYIISKRDKKAVKSLFNRALKSKNNVTPRVITIDMSRANLSAIKPLKKKSYSNFILLHSICIGTLLKKELIYQKKEISRNHTLIFLNT